MTVAPSPHPTAVELARWLDGRLEPDAAARVTTHVAGCVLCQATAEDARSSLYSVDDDALEGLRYASPEIGQAAHTAIGGRRGTQPASGQIWRLEWNGYVTLALIIEVGGDGPYDPVLVAPVSTDLESADQYTLCLGTARSSLAIPLAIWVALRTRVPRFTLDLSLGEANVVKEADELYDHFLDDQSYVPEGEQLTVGMAIVSRADPRWQYREHIAEVIAELADAGERLKAAGEAGPLGDLVAEKSVTPRKLGEVLGLTAPETYALLSGTIEPTSTQAAILAERLNVEVDKVLAYRRAPNAELWLAWSFPETRDRVDEVADRTGRSIHALRRTGTDHVFRLAARKTGSDATDASAWRRLIYEWLDAQA